MSILPKIKIGLPSRRSTFNLSQDTHTTAEIGYFQPTFCRTVVPGSHVEISSRNMVRLSPLAVPTMGRLALRNYYYFVDMATLWTPFDALRNQTNYTYGDGSVSVPTYCPTFSLNDFFNIINEVPDDALGLGASAVRDGIHATVYVVGDMQKPYSGDVNTSIYGDEGDDSIAENLGNVGVPFAPFWLTTVNSSGQTVVWEKKQNESDGGLVYSAVTSATSVTEKFGIVTNQDADFSFITKSTANRKIYVLGKFTGAAKRLRKMFLGCGYSFNPFDKENVTPFKLFAVYKAWYDTMAIQRTSNWNNTNCYKVIKALSETYSNRGKIYDSYDDSVWKSFNHFLGDLSDICYMLPADYFSASDLTSTRGAVTPNSSDVEITSTMNATNYGYPVIKSASANFQTPVDASDTSAIATQMAQKLLRFVNKRSVVGRKLADLLNLNGEVDLHNNEHENVHHLGEDKTDINISDVMSLASTSDASLGDYAGRGVGVGANDTFSYDSKCYGILLCLSAIVPQSGYFQGILKENKDNTRFEWFDPTFDAVGYQSLELDELIADNQFCSAENNQNAGTNVNGMFGITPRYQHLKIGRNICNGDMSLPSMQSVMLPYTLDRHFVSFVPDLSTKCGYKDFVLPSNTPESFRQIKATDSYGDYNRIFQYVNGDYDHFIMQMVFNAKVTSPMKSIADSYDTFDESNDGNSIDVEHM